MPKYVEITSGKPSRVPLNIENVMYAIQDEGITLATKLTKVLKIKNSDDFVENFAKNCIRPFIKKQLDSKKK